MSIYERLLVALVGIIIGLGFGIFVGSKIMDRHREGLYWDAHAMALFAENQLNDLERNALETPDLERRAVMLRQTTKQRELFRHLQQALEARRP